MKNEKKNWLKENWIPTIIVVVVIAAMFLSSVSSEARFKVYKGIEMEGEEFIKDIETEEGFCAEKETIKFEDHIYLCRNQEWLDENCECLTRGDRIIDKSCNQGETINQNCFNCETYFCDDGYIVEVWYQ